MRQADHYPVTGLLMSLMILGTQKGEQVSTRVKMTLRPPGQTADTLRIGRDRDAKTKIAAHHIVRQNTNKPSGKQTQI